MKRPDAIFISLTFLAVTLLTSCQPAVDKVFTDTPEGDPDKPLGCLLKWCPVEDETEGE
jgi:hypothetical protein